MNGGTRFYAVVLEKGYETEFDHMIADSIAQVSTGRLFLRRQPVLKNSAFAAFASGIAGCNRTCKSRAVVIDRKEASG